MDWHQRLVALLYEGGGMYMQEGSELLTKAGAPLTSHLLLFHDM